TATANSGFATRKVSAVSGTVAYLPTGSTGVTITRDGGATWTNEPVPTASVNAVAATGAAQAFGGRVSGRTPPPVADARGQGEVGVGVGVGPAGRERADDGERVGGHAGGKRQVHGGGLGPVERRADRHDEGRTDRRTGPGWSRGRRVGLPPGRQPDAGRVLGG